MEMARNPSRDGMVPLSGEALLVAFDFLAVVVEPSGRLLPHPLGDKARQRTSNLRAIDRIVARDRRSIASELKFATLRCIANATR